jgi:succinoglycan biosynthesis protein ExoA
LAQSSRFGVGGASFRGGMDRPRYVDTLAFGAYRRDVFRRIGEFDEELVRNQDDEFNFRLSHRGGKIWLDPSIRSVYYSRVSLRRLWSQYFQYGFWKVRVMQKHTHQMSLRHFVPPAAVAALVAGGFLSALSPTIFYLWLALLILYALASIIASIGASCRGGYVVVLPVAFVTLHLSYGLGFLVGLVRFWNRW